MVCAQQTFPTVFGSGGRSRPHSAEYKQFGKYWGFQKTLFELANDEITKVSQVKEEYLTDTLLFLTYTIKKQEMERVEDQYQENIRKATKKH